MCQLLSSIYLQMELFPMTLSVSFQKSANCYVLFSAATSVYFDPSTYQEQEGNSGITNVALTVCHLPATTQTSFCKLKRG